MFLVAVVLSACSSGSSDPVDEDPFDFDTKDYPGIVVLPFDAYKANRASTPADGVLPRAVLFEKIHEDTSTSRDVMRFYLT